MLAVLRVLVLIFGLLAPAAYAHAADVYILGDSIGEGVAYASHARRLARVSVHIRGRQPLDQIAQTPIGATAILVLGSNDAEGPFSDLDRHIDNIVQAAAKRNIRLIWVGPHCVRRRWDNKARELDQYLSTALQARNIVYVSTRDPELCMSRLYEGDGVHLKMPGYAYIWEKARAAAGLPEGPASKGNSTLASAEQATENPNPEKTHRRKKQADKRDDDDTRRPWPASERRYRERGFFGLFD